MLLKPSPVSTEKFHYDPDGQVFYADISDLGKGFEFGRVYDDALDEGLTLVSQWTGKEVVFVLEREVTDREGDVNFWQFRSVKAKKDFLVILAND